MRGGNAACAVTAAQAAMPAPSVVCFDELEQARADTPAIAPATNSVPLAIGPRLRLCMVCLRGEIPPGPMSRQMTAVTSGRERERTRLDVAGAAVLRDDHAARRDAALDELESCVGRPLGEQPAAASDGDREDLQPQLVDQVVLEQRLDQRATAVDLQLRSRSGLELP